MSGKTQSRTIRSVAQANSRRREFFLILTIQGTGRVRIHKGGGPEIEIQKSTKIRIPEGNSVEIEAESVPGGPALRGFTRSDGHIMNTTWLRVRMNRDIALTAVFEPEGETPPEPEGEPQQEITDQDKLSSDYAASLAERF